MAGSVSRRSAILYALRVVSDLLYLLPFLRHIFGPELALQSVPLLNISGLRGYD
jgi:hypothetical protein